MPSVRTLPWLVVRVCVPAGAPCWNKRPPSGQPLSLVTPTSSLQGILLVYDITNRWSFDGIDRWIKEIDEVGIPAHTPFNGRPLPKAPVFPPPREPPWLPCAACPVAWLCASFLTLITVALEGQGLMPQGATAHGSEPYLVIESGWGQLGGAFCFHACAESSAPSSMHLGSPGSWLGTGCTWPSRGKFRQSRLVPTQRRTA